MAGPFPVRAVADGVVSVSIATDSVPYLNPEFVARFSATVELVSADTSVRAVVLEGGQRYFSAGASREALLGVLTGEGIIDYTAQLTRAILAVPVPTIAAMAGHAIGGGFVLGLWCDMPLLAKESLYGANFMALGFTPGMGATTVLEEVLGGPLARELLFTGRLIKGRELKQMGCPLAHAVMPRAEVNERALSIAREIADVPREALLRLKESLGARRRTQAERAMEDEQANHRYLFGDPETYRQIGHRYDDSFEGCMDNGSRG